MLHSLAEENSWIMKDGGYHFPARSRVARFCHARHPSKLEYVYYYPASLNSAQLTTQKELHSKK